MGVGNQVHASMQVYSKHTCQSAAQKLKAITYFDWLGVRFGQVGGAGSAGPEVAAAAVAAAVLDAAVLDAAAGPRAVVAAAVGLPAVAAGISAAAAAE